MRQLMLGPVIYKYNDCKTFCKEFHIGKDDLIITGKEIYNNCLKFNVNEAAVLFKENYGIGNMSEDIVESMYEHVRRISHERIIAIGEKCILEIGKIFSLTNISPVVDLYNNKIEIIKEKELVLVPTKLGIGSEVNNVSELELKENNMKVSLVADELYADSTVMITELLSKLPLDLLISSSMNALIHALESYLSPRATEYTRLFSLKAVEIIFRSYKNIINKEMVMSSQTVDDFLLAGNYSEIAFANTGGDDLDVIKQELRKKDNTVTYGEANYITFMEMLKSYQGIYPDSDIIILSGFFANLLECDTSEVFEQVENILCKLIIKSSPSKRR